MIIIKGISILAGLLIVPLTLKYVSSDTYGIWLAISSMVAWFSFFDIGLNNGLKNRLTEALANNDYYLAKKYVSTTYAILTIIFIPLMIILLGIAPFIDWYSLLNLSQGMVDGLLASVCIVICYFCINFIFSTINVVFNADQRPADAAFRSLIQQLLTLAVIYILTFTTKGSLINLCISLCACPIIVIAIVSIISYNGRYRDIAPSIKDIDFKTAPDLFNLGIKFFIIQIAGVVQYQMTNFLIIHYFGATEVTEYNIAYKYFNVPYMIWGIILAPVWVAVTDAITKNDFLWIKNSLKKYLILFCVFIAGTVLMLAVSDPLYHLWMGDKVDIPFSISLWVMIFNLTMMFGSLFVNILNGAGILNIQTVACIISPLVFLGCCFLFIHIGWGVKSILISSIIANFNGLILAPIQCYRFLHNK